MTSVSLQEKLFDVGLNASSVEALEAPFPAVGSRNKIALVVAEIQLLFNAHTSTILCNTKT